MLCAVYIPVMYVLNMRNVRCFLWDLAYRIRGLRNQKHFGSNLFATAKQHGKDSHVLAAMTIGIKMAQTSPRC